MRLALTVLIVAASALAAQERPLPEPGPFFQQVRRHLATDEERQSGYTFIERRTDQRLDASGRVTSETTKMFEVYPGLPGEQRYRRLIAENGRPVDRDTLDRHDHARRREVHDYLQSQQMPARRERAARERDTNRRRYEAAIDDLFRVYDIALVRRERVEGHDTIFVTLDPKPDARPQTDEGRIMRVFRAHAWISESDHELVKAEVEAIRDLTFGLGLLGRVHKGTLASYERRKVGNQVWLPHRVTWTGSGRVLLVRRLRVRGVSEFSDYRKSTVDTSTTYTPR